jgi:hypothetical protein
MKVRGVWLGVLLVCLLSVGVPQAGAVDTSPYIVGDYAFEDTAAYSETTTFGIVNPTKTTLNVYAGFFDSGGNFMGCMVNTVAPNGLWYITDYRLPGSRGTAKFLAFPAGQRKFDPNAVIGGLQVKYRTKQAPLRKDEWFAAAEYNMKAVTINSSTIGEFSAPWISQCLF